MRRPESWLALVRVVVGYWFLKSLFSKIEWTVAGGVLPVPTATDRWVGFMPTRVQEWAEINPLGWYRAFLTDAVLPNSELFAQLAAFGEVAVGIGLTFGFLTGYAALGGLLLTLNYLLASLGVPFTQQGLHVILPVCMLAFLGARAGRAWGVDGWLLHRSATYRRVPLV